MEREYTAVGLPSVVRREVGEEVGEPVESNWWRERGEWPEWPMASQLGWVVPPPRRTDQGLFGTDRVMGEDQGEEREESES